MLIMMLIKKKKSNISCMLIAVTETSNVDFYKNYLNTATSLPYSLPATTREEKQNRRSVGSHLKHIHYIHSY